MTQANPLFLQNPEFSYDAADMRFVWDTLFTEGVTNVAAGNVTAGAVTDGTLRLTVAPGAAFIKGDDVTNQGTYVVRCTASETITAAAPPGAGSRLDLLVWEVIDSAAVPLAGRPEGSRFRTIAGTPVTSGSPALPTLPPTAIAIASFPVAAGQTTIPAASITDLRAQSGAAGINVSTSFLRMSTAQRDAITGPQTGQAIFNTTNNRFEWYNSRAWRPFGTPAPASQAFTYNGDGTSATIVDKDAAGTTIKTATFAYTSGVLTTITEVEYGYTTVTTFTYTSGALTGMSRTVS